MSRQSRTTSSLHRILGANDRARAVAGLGPSDDRVRVGSDPRSGVATAVVFGVVAYGAVDAGSPSSFLDRLRQGVRERQDRLDALRAEVAGLRGRNVRGDARTSGAPRAEEAEDPSPTRPSPR